MIDTPLSVPTSHITQHSAAFTVDVEDWFHILDSDAVPNIEQWPSLESQIESNLGRLLNLLACCSVRATFFWLGWIAERHKQLVRDCQAAGHEIASHGYGHVLAYQVGRPAFAEDIRRAKMLLEDITGERVVGFRAAGFSVRDDTTWTFEEIRASGHSYDSSVFPANREHGGMRRSPLQPYVVETAAGDLVEIPQSMVEFMGKRLSFFGGGYLRLSPKWLIRWGITALHKAGRPLIVYIHPREINPNHPRLPLPLRRRFKCYVNLHTTFKKLEWLCQNHHFETMRNLMNGYIGQPAAVAETAPDLLKMQPKKVFGQVPG